MTLPPIYFYLPRSYLSRPLPTSPGANAPEFGLGIYAWILQTYLYLRENSFPCELTDRFPSEGIVLAHHNTLRGPLLSSVPNTKLLPICIKADGSRHPLAPLHIVQNPDAADARRGCYYLPHWPQPGLLPRSAERGDRFETIAYFGHIANLAPELRSPDWEKRLAAMGLQWQPIVNRHHWSDCQSVDSRWNDYRAIDAIVAIRGFGRRRTHTDKPATKLYNAWLAAVPTVMGVESAYRTEGRDRVDYLEVTSLEETFAALEKLGDDPALRRTLVDNGSIAGRQFTPAKILDRWRAFLLDVAIPAFEDWISLPRYRQQIIGQRNYYYFFVEKVKRKLLAR
jgi:hypothetical protein